MLISKIKYKFCVNWSAPTNIVVSQLKMKDPIFLKQNSDNVFKLLKRQVEENNWSSINNFISHNNLTVIDKWNYWINFAEVINLSLQQMNYSTISSYEFYSMLDALKKLNYEPDASHDGQLINNIQKHLQKSSNIKQKITIGSHMLQCFPYLFQKYRQQFQQHILSSIIENKQLKAVVFQGFKVNFWSHNFMNIIFQFKNKGILDKHFIESLQFIDLSHPNQEVKSKLPSPSSTQNKIGFNLQHLGYNFTKNVFINNMQVDILFPQNQLIVEYYGPLHYKINAHSSELIPNLRSKWRQQIFKNRGYDFIVVSFEEWQKLKHFKYQQIFLMQKIENYLVQKYYGKEILNQVSGIVENNLKKWQF